MSWKSISREEAEFTKLVVKWIKTVREAYDDINWLPTESDPYKSALLERLRNGLEPLEFPPPLGLSCPWYAVVEDPGPHWVELKKEGIFFLKDMEDIHFGTPCNYYDATHVSLLQHNYTIVEKISPTEFTVKDYKYESPWVFRVWWDEHYRYTSIARNPPRGAWLMRNMEFE